jgi:hypothetical protein
MWTHETWRGAALASLLLLAVVGACSTSDDEAAPIPTRTVEPTTLAPVVTEPGGSPAVEAFVAPETFVCLAEDPRQAQVTLGWDVPTATEVAISLDGEPVPSGIRDELPFEVPAGGARGIGTTVVFACDGSDARTITIAWSIDGSPPTEQVVNVVRGTDGA